MNFDTKALKMFMRPKTNYNRYWMIAGIVVGAAALLTYPAMLLYRRYANKKNQGTDKTNIKSFAPTYRGSHKPHHRKVEANGKVQSHA